jgi:hypothetical protein
MNDSNLRAATLVSPGGDVRHRLTLDQLSAVIDSIRKGEVRDEDRARLADTGLLAEQDDNQHWQEFGWARPREFVHSVARGRATSADSVGDLDHMVDGVFHNWQHVTRALNRRSSYGATTEMIDARTWRAIVKIATAAVKRDPSLLVGFVVEAVEGMRVGTYLLRPGPTRLVCCDNEVDQQLMRRVGQGQGFLRNGGATLFIGIDWDEVRRTGLDPELSYHEALLSCGRLGHAVLLEALQSSLACRMTPAVHESTAAKLFCIENDSRDMLYLMKFGHPRTSMW